MKNNEFESEIVKQFLILSLLKTSKPLKYIYLDMYTNWVALTQTPNANETYRISKVGFWISGVLRYCCQELMSKEHRF